MPRNHHGKRTLQNRLTLIWTSTVHLYCASQTLNNNFFFWDLPIHREMPLNPLDLGNLAGENRSWLFRANYATKSGNFWWATNVDFSWTPCAFSSPPRTAFFLQVFPSERKEKALFLKNNCFVFFVCRFLSPSLSLGTIRPLADKNPWKTISIFYVFFPDDWSSILSLVLLYNPS